MSTIEKLKTRLAQGTRLTCAEVRILLRFLGYSLAQQRGSHEQWVRKGRTFALAAHGKDAPHYILDDLRNLMEADHGQSKTEDQD